MFTTTASQSYLLGLGSGKTIARMRMRDAIAPTTIAVGSSGASIPQSTLNVASASSFSSQGTGICQLSNGGYAVFTWTGTTASTFTGITWDRTSGTLASTGGTVASTPDYSAIGALGMQLSNWMRSVSWKESVDDYVATWTVKIARDNFAQSMAPLITGSVFNAGAGQMVQKHREMWIEVATLSPNNQNPALTDWVMVMHGYSDKVDWGQDPITITGRDLGGQLQDTQIEKVRNYGVWGPGQSYIVGIRAVDQYLQNSAPPSTLYWWEVTTAGTSQGNTWTANKSYIATGAGGNGTVGDYVCPTVTSGGQPQQFFQCTQAGTSGSTEPTWPAAGIFTTVIDGGAHWVQVDPSISAAPDPLAGFTTTTIPTDGQTVAESGASTLVWTARVPAARLNTHAYTVNQVIFVPQGAFTQYWVCTTAGTSNGSTPSFPANPSLGATVSDGGTLVWSLMPCPGGNLLETAMQQLWNDNNTNLSGTIVVSNLPAGQANTGKYLSPWSQQQEDVWSALQALSIQVGYDLRFRKNSTTGDFSLTLYYVNRSTASPVTTLNSDFYEDLQVVSDDVTNIRNAVAITFLDNSLLNGLTSYGDAVLGNVPIRKKVVYTDATSIAANGRRFCEIDEGASLQTNDPTSASFFANALLSDLKGDFIETQMVGPIRWDLQLQDTVTISGDNFHWDTSQATSIVSMDHEISENEERSTISFRGTPTAGFAKYHDNVLATGNTWAPNVSTPVAPSNVAATSGIGGTVVTFDNPIANRLRNDHTEIHSSATPKFTPSGSTLTGLAKGGNFNLTGQLTPYQAAIAPASAGASLPQSTITVGSTAGWPSSGTVAIPLSGGGTSIVTYGSLTATTFASCTGGSGTIAAAGSIATFVYYVRAAHRDVRHGVVTASKQVTVAPGGNLLSNLDLSIRQNMLGFIAADTALPSLGNAIPFSTTYTNGNTKIGFDQSGLWDPTLTYWTPTQTGKWSLDVTMDVTGANPGDTLQLIWIASPLTPGTIVDVSPLLLPVTDNSAATQATRIVGNWHTNFNVPSSLVGHHFVLTARYEGSAVSLTLKAPNMTGGLLGNTILYPGCSLEITQRLA